MIEKLARLIAPHTCLVCGVEGALIHKGCMRGYDLVPQCLICGALDRSSTTCRRCKPSIGVSHGYAAYSLEGWPKQLIAALKYENMREAASIIADQIVAKLPAYMPGYTVTNIPTISKHVRARGYDHTELIARHVARRLGLPYRKLLLRSGSSVQVGSKRSDRLNQLTEAFLSMAKSPTNVVLIDDVMTTGGTIRACTRELRRSGARDIRAAVFCRSLV